MKANRFMKMQGYIMVNSLPVESIITAQHKFKHMYFKIILLMFGLIE